MRLQPSVLVWKGTNILLDGIALPIPEVPFPDSQTVQDFIRRLQQGRRHIAALAISYLRGKTYLAEKQSHGGKRSNGQASVRKQHLNGPASVEKQHLKTRQWLAREFQVSEGSIHSDTLFAVAVDSIAAHCGEQAREILLARAGGLTRKDVFWLAQLPKEEQQRLLRELQEKGKLPRRTDGPKKTITLRREPQAFAAKVRQSFDDQEFAAILKALLGVRNQRTM